MFGNDLSKKEQEMLFAQEVSSNKQKAGILMTELNGMNGKLKKSYNNLGLVSAELPLSKVRELAESGNVEYISTDREVRSFGHIGQTVGWTNPGIADLGDNNSNTWLTEGVGHIVIIDSGIDPNNFLTRYTDYGGSSKIKYNKDFTGENITGDPYGHGTHVTSLFSGGYMNATGGAYENIANASNIINLRVLNSTGTGTAGNLIAALDCSHLMIHVSRFGQKQIQLTEFAIS
jgi:hypothetical protein